MEKIQNGCFWRDLKSPNFVGVNNFQLICIKREQTIFFCPSITYVYQINIQNLIVITLINCLMIVTLRELQCTLCFYHLTHLY